MNENLWQEYEARRDEIAKIQEEKLKNNLKEKELTEADKKEFRKQFVRDAKRREKERERRQTEYNIPMYFQFRAVSDEVGPNYVIDYLYEKIRPKGGFQGPTTLIYGLNIAHISFSEDDSGRLIVKLTGSCKILLGEVGAVNALARRESPVYLDGMEEIKGNEPP